MTNKSFNDTCTVKATVEQKPVLLHFLNWYAALNLNIEFNITKSPHKNASFLLHHHHYLILEAMNSEINLQGFSLLATLLAATTPIETLTIKKIKYFMAGITDFCFNVKCNSYWVKFSNWTLLLKRVTLPWWRAWLSRLREFCVTYKLINVSLKNSLL